MSGIRRRTWVLALFAALLIHGGAAVLLVWQPPTTGAQSYGAAGVAVGLAAAGAPPGADAAGDPALAEAEAAAAESAKTAEAETAQDVGAVRTETARAVEVEPVTTETAKDVEARDAPPVAAASVEAEAPAEAEPSLEKTPPQAAQAETRLAEPLPPAAESPTASPSEPLTVDAAEADVADAELPEPDAKEAAAAAPPPPPERPVLTDQEPRSVGPEPPREDRTLPAPERTAEPVEAQEGGTEIAVAPAATAPPGGGDSGRQAAPSGSAGRAGSKAAPGTGDGPGAEGGGSPGERADFLAQLQAWLERHKEYPRRAQRRRQEGTALLYFVMSQDGRVLDFRIEESSGHEALDREVQAMIRRAQPLPAIPASMRQSRLELVVPIVFSLR